MWLREKAMVPCAPWYMNSRLLVQLSCAFEFQYAASFKIFNMEKERYSWSLSSMLRKARTNRLFVIE